MNADAGEYPPIAEWFTDPNKKPLESQFSVIKSH